MVGHYGTNCCSVGTSFLYSGGTFTTIAVPGASITSVTGINNAGQIVGEYSANLYTAYGFLDNGGTYTTLPATPTGMGQIVAPTGINNAGQIVGIYANSAGFEQGFLYNPVPACVLCSNYTTIIDPSGLLGTSPTGINDAGEIVGYYGALGSYPYQGFLFDNGIYTTLDYPGAALTYLWGINDAGEIVGEYCDTTVSPCYGFLFDYGIYTTLLYPGATDTSANGINDQGQIVGIYENNFTPLPPTWTMMLAGLAGFGLLSYRRKKISSAAVQVAA
jgi:uncharacterized membrane protein